MVLRAKIADNHYFQTLKRTIILNYQFYYYFSLIGHTGIIECTTSNCIESQKTYKVPKINIFVTYELLLIYL